MKTQEHDSRALGALGRYIDKIVYYEDASFPAGLKLLPYPHCRLTINLSESIGKNYRLDGTPIATGESFNRIITMQTKPIVCSELNNATAIVVYLKPYALRTLNGMRPTVGGVIDAATVLPTIGSLRTELQEANSTQRLAITERYLQQEMRSLPEATLRRLEAVCGEFAAGETDLDEVAAKLHFSKRSIHDLITRYTALNPKTLAHLYTFSRFVECINKAPRPIHWPTIVEQLGLYDQSYLIKVFKKMTGMTPTEWYSAIESSNYPADEWVRPADSQE